MEAWCEVDDFLRDPIEMFRRIHRDCPACTVPIERGIPGAVGMT